nr:hypothetical protein [Actinomadura logoneensis]
MKTSSAECGRGEDQLGRVRAGGRERQPQQRRLGEVEVGGPVLLQEAGEVGVRVGARGEVGVPPGQVDAARDGLHVVAVVGGDERGAQVRVPVQQGLPGGAQPVRVGPSGQVEDELHVVGVEVVPGEHRVEQQPGLERGERPDVGEAPVPLLPVLDLVLPDARERHVRGGEAARAGRRRVPGQALQRGLPQVGQLAHVVRAEHAGRMAEPRGQPRPFRGVGDQGVDVQARQRRQVVVRGGDQLGRLRGAGEAEAAQVFGVVGLGVPANVVERDLPARQRGQLLGGVRVEVAQEAVADALVGDAEQLLLDGFDGAARRRSPGDRVVHVGVPDVQAHRVHAGEPADRAGQVRAGHHLLLAAVPLQPDQQGRLVHAAPAPPARDGQRERGEQPVVHAAVVGGGQPGQHGVGDGRGQPHPVVPDGGRDVHGRVERAVAEHRVGAVHDGAPQRHLVRAPRGLLGERVRPAPHGGPDLGQLRRESVADPLPGGGEVGQQDPPGHAVHDQVVQDDQEPSPRGRPVEPDELGHDPGGGVEAPGGGVEFGGGDLVPGVVRAADAGEQRRHAHRSGRRDVEAVGDEPGPQRVVPVQDGAQGREQAGLVDAVRQVHDHRHREAVDPAAEPHEELADRQERGDAHAAAGQLLQSALLAGLGRRDLGEPRDRAALEHLARGEGDPVRARARDDLDRADAVAAAGEEVVVHTDPVDAEDLGVHRREDLLLGRAGGLVLAAGELGLGERRAVQLAGRGERQPVQDDEHRRDHELRQPGGDEAAQLGGRHPGGQVHVPVPSALGGLTGPPGRDDVADQVAARGQVVRGHHGLRDAGVRGQRRLDLAGFDPEAAHLELRVVAAGVLQGAAGGPAREVAGAVHALAGRAERVGDEPLGGQPGAAVVAAPDLAGDVQLADHARRDGHQARPEHVRAHVPERRADRRAAVRVGGQGPVHDVRGRVEALRLAVGVDDPDARERLAHPPHQRGGQRLAREDQAVHAGVGRDLVHQLGEHRRDGADHAAVPAAALAELQDVPDDLDDPAGRQRRDDLEHRHVEADRGPGEHPRAGPQPDGRGEPGHAVHHAAVRDCDALRRPGRAGRVEHVRHVVRLRRDGLVVRGAVVRAVQPEVLQVEAGHVGTWQEAAGRAVGEQEQRLGLVEDVLQPRARVARVDRQVARAGLQDRQQRDDQVRRAREGEPDQRLRPDAAPDERPRQPVRARVHLPVGQLAALPDDRDGVRGLGGTPLDQAGDGVPGRRRGRGVPGGEPVALVGGEDVHGADPRAGVGGEPPQDPDEPVPHPLGGGPVEQVGRVLQAAAQPAAVRVLGEVELQVELGGAGAGRGQRRRRARDVQLDAGVGLPAEHDLEQRVVRGGAVRVEGLHDPLERGVLVVVGGQGAVPDPVQDAVQRRVAGQVRAQHPGVDEEPDEVGELLLGAARDGRADGHVVARAQVVQQDGERGLHRHRRGHALRARQLGDGGGQPGVDPDVDDVSLVARAGRARPVGGQPQPLGGAGQLVPPVAELGRQDALRVVLVAEHLALPQRVVAVLDGQPGPVGRVPGEPGGVGGGEVAGQRHGRLAVHRDVVDHEDQDVVVRRGAQQPGVHGHVLGEVEPVRGRLGDRGVHAVRAGLHQRDGQLQVGRGHDALLRRAALVLREDGAQALVPDDHVP